MPSLQAEAAPKQETLTGNLADGSPRRNQVCDWLALELTDAQQRITDILAEQIGAEFICWHEYRGGSWAFETLHGNAGEISPQSLRQLNALGKRAFDSLHVEQLKQVGPDRTMFAAPILRGEHVVALLCVMSRGAVPSNAAGSVTLAASCLSVRRQAASLQDSLVHSDTLLALVELVEKSAESHQVAQCCHTIATLLQSHLECQRVAVGIVSGARPRPRLKAISDRPTFDRHSAAVQTMESAMEEACDLGCDVGWPEPGGQSPSHRRLCVEGVTGCASLLWRNVRGDVVAVVTFFLAAPDQLDRCLRFGQAIERPLSNLLASMLSMEGGPLAKSGRRIREWLHRCGRGVLALVLGFVVLALVCPFPYTVRCDCRIEPVVRRFVAAPFDGTLAKSLVAPGDVVQEGDLLARLDDRELRLKQTRLNAERQQAIQKRHAAQASHRYAEAKIAQLEIERIDQDLKLLAHHFDNLEIKSPVNGVVIEGDVERVEGAPVQVGQTLFEIGPLEKMIVEVAIPDDEIANVPEGARLAVRLESFGGKKLNAQVQSIEPRSEIRDDENVFIAQADLDNTSGMLRPGMEGRARIRSGYKPLGLVLFEKPWRYLVRIVAW